jgi:response regulator
MDMVSAMQFGADDYITKPIDINLTRVKIQAILRRTYEYTMQVDKLTFEGISLDTSRAKLSGESFDIDLTKTELLILEALFNAKGQIVRREDIMDHCWQGDDFIDDNTLAVNITRLRKKLDNVGYKEFIQTKKGMGYYLVR